MDRLDACYFCGTAGEAQLREVSIAPRARRGDPDATVATTLCPSCEGKLQTLLGRVFDNVESRRVEDAGGATDESAGADGDASAGGGGDATAGADGGRAAADDPDKPVDRIDVSGESGDAPRGDGDRQPLFDPAPDVREVPEPDDDGATAASGGAPSEAGDAPSGTDASGSAAADPPGEDAEILADDDEPTVRARASSTPADPLDGVSVAEYNRVMRLLQNREFPMAREAFVDLASSAYDLETGAVQQVLDAVVDKGALAERDGDLVRPGGAGRPGGSGGEPS